MDSDDHDDTYGVVAQLVAQTKVTGSSLVCPAIPWSVSSVG